MEKRGRGRPRKNTTINIPQSTYVNIDIPKEGQFIRENKYSNYNKFERSDLLKRYLRDFLNPNDHNPLGIIFYNCNSDTLSKVRYQLPYIAFEESKELITTLLTQQFEILKNQYNRINAGNIKTLCYTAHINLDMRKYRNLSIINQIIYEIQQQFFPDQFTIWKLQAPAYEGNPFYTLRLIISNASIHGTTYISYMFSGDCFDDLAGRIYGRIAGTKAICTSSKTGNVQLKPLSIIENDIPYNPNKPVDISILDWYKINYGDYITNNNPTRMINTKPYNYERNKNSQ